MNNNLKYTIEIITDADKLTEAFSLRYKIYQTAYPLLVQHHTQPYEYDGFDVRSIHLGLYWEENNEKKLVGYCRLIIPEFFIDNFSKLLPYTFPSFINTISWKQKLGFIKQMHKPEEISKMNSFCGNLEIDDKFYLQGGRLIIDDEHRSVAVFSFFMSSIFAVGKFLNVKYFFVSCAYHHAPFYEKLGLELLNYEVEYGTDISGKPQVVFGTYLDDLNLSQTLVENYKLQMQLEGQIKYEKAA